jgi:hypothetical protein
VVTGESVKIAFVDHGYTGDYPLEGAQQYGIRSKVVKLPIAKRGIAASAELQTADGVLSSGNNLIETESTVGTLVWR